jgi:hypothetical protein
MMAAVGSIANVCRALQITELLSEVRVNYDKTVVIQHLLRKLYEVVQNVPEQEVLDPLLCSV